MTADDYERRVRAYEAEGMTRGDAQGVVEAEDLNARRGEVSATVQGKCERCKVAYRWKKRGRWDTLRGAYCPECGESLYQTTHLLQWPWKDELPIRRPELCRKPRKENA